MSRLDPKKDHSTFSRWSPVRISSTNRRLIPSRAESNDRNVTQEVQDEPFNFKVDKFDPLGLKKQEQTLKVGCIGTPPLGAFLPAPRAESHRSAHQFFAY